MDYSNYYEDIDPTLNQSDRRSIPMFLDDEDEMDVIEAKSILFCESPRSND
jgi:hypothetical protein